MTLVGVLMRLLWSRRAASLAVMLGMAVATAVITGALVLGQSVTGTLHDIALKRIGPVQYAVLGAGVNNGSGASGGGMGDVSGGGEFFSEELAQRLEQATGRRCIAGILTRGQLVAEDASGGTLAAASGIQIIALDQALDGGNGASKEKPEGGQLGGADSQETWSPSGEVRLSQGAAGALNHPPQGASILLHLPKPEDTPAEAVLARRGRADRLTALRVTVGESVAGDAFRDSFELFATQRQARNAWVALRDLQRALGQPGRANIILVGPPVASAMPPGADRQAPGFRGELRLGQDANETGTVLQRVMALEDYGLTLAAPPTFPAGVPVGDDAQVALLQARSGYLSFAVEKAAYAACGRMSAQRQDASRAAAPNTKINQIVCEPVLTFLMTEVTLTPRPERDAGDSKLTVPQGSASPRQIHYVLASGYTPAPGATAGEELPADQVVLNDWAMTQLGAQVGDTITFRFLQRPMADDTAGPVSGGALVASDPMGPLRIARSIPVDNGATSPSLTPSYAGITDTASIRDWRPPAGFPFDPKLVTASDEEYWKRYRTMPRVYLPLSVARRCGVEPGTDANLTSMRLRREDVPAFGPALLQALTPAAAGITVRNLRQEQLAAATGSTDFASLFLALSMVLLLVAVLLVVLLFRLLTEQQSPQIGLLLALGFTPGRIWRLCLLQGAVLALCGTLLGIPLGLGYAAVLIRGLTTWWLPALGTTELTLHSTWPPPLWGGATGWLLALAAVAWALRLLRQQTPIGLLRNRSGLAVAAHAPRARRPGKGHAASAAVAAGGVVTLLALHLGRWITWPAALVFLLIGLGSLVALLEFAAWRIIGRAGQMNTGRAHGLSMLQLSWRNSTRRPARSLLTLWLIALAVFLLTTLAAFQRPAAHPSDEATGGYELIVTSDQPLLGDLNTTAGRKLLGISPTDEPLWQRAQFTGVWVHDGQDISCRNLTRPTAPRILGVPTSAGRFGNFPAFGSATGVPPVSPATSVGETTTGTTPTTGGTPVPLTESTRHDDASIACLADEETATYLLKLGVGDVLTLPTPDRSNNPVNLRLANLLPAGIFQGELLISQADFRTHFGRPEGPRVILVRCPPADAPALRAALQHQLADYSITVETVAERMAGFQAIANTYLATFQSLGYLALFLGTLGLAIVLLRNVLERRAELALLAALGFAPGRRLRLVLMENAWLLLVGMAIGLLAAVPALLPSWSQVHVLNLLAPLGLVLAGGLATLALVTSLALGFAGRLQLREE